MNNETPAGAQGSPQQRDAVEPVNDRNPSRDKCVRVDHLTRLGRQYPFQGVGYACISDAQVRASADNEMSAASLSGTVGHYIFAIHSCPLMYNHGRPSSGDLGPALCLIA